MASLRPTRHRALTSLPLLLALMPIVAWGAQTEPVLPTAANGQGQENAANTPTPTLAQLADIIVRGSLERKSSWRRAEGLHAIVYSNGSEAELRRVTANLDREYALLAHIFDVNSRADDTRKLEVTLIGGEDFARSMKLRNIRSEEGPYATPFTFQRYYDPRDTGAILAVGRSDQLIPVAAELADVDPGDAFDDAGDAFAGLGDDDSFDADPFPGRGGLAGLHRPIHPPQAVRSWDALLYSAFAQHFVLTQFPAAYPRWYLDGIGALFSTLNVRKDGTIEYGRTPEAFAAVYNSYPAGPFSEAISGVNLTQRKRATWSPYQAWIIAHYLFFGTLTPDRRQQFVRYMTQIAQGVPQATAASTFGDPAVLDAELHAYGQGKTLFYSMSSPSGLSEPIVDRLSAGDAKLLKERVELGSRLEMPPLLDASLSAKDRAKAAKVHAALSERRDEFMAEIRSDVAELPDNLAAFRFLAEVECRADHADACAAAADHALALLPDDPVALGWKAMALVQKAILAPSDTREAQFNAARAAVIAANRIDEENLVPLLAYYRLYSQTARPVPQPALLGMLKVIERVPTAPGPRLGLGREMMRQGMQSQARDILLPVAAGAYDSPERAEAAALMH